MTVCRRVDKMGKDIVEQVVGKLSNSFFLQLDESTDISGNAQLVGLVRYIDADNIYETTGEDIFDSVNTFFTENSISWKSCSSNCTDAAASMTGSVRGFIAQVKKENPEVNARLFRRLSENTGAEHTQLQLHTEVRLLSRGKILNGLLELRSEDTDFLAKLSYLADIFRKLNELNMSLQGKDTNILNLYDKVGGFQKKAKLWKMACAQGNFTCFPQDFLSSEDVGRAPVKLVIVGHLTTLIQDFHSYFPDTEEKSAQLDWVRNPCLVSEANRSKLPVTYQEKLVEVSSDRGFQMKFSTSTLTQFWVFVKQEHPDLGQKALEFCSLFLWTEFLGTARGRKGFGLGTTEFNLCCLQMMLFCWLHQTRTFSVHWGSLQVSAVRAG
uniref:DUF4371 domain-containing protein n=1 Tax=Stegastes partitus TaxID=144197 RepID=A0A3B4ZJ55_9TELE